VLLQCAAGATDDNEPPSPPVKVELQINGNLRSLMLDPRTTLLDALRENLQLFGTKQSRIARMNEAAPAFFRLVQDVLLDMSVLRIARLTDPPKSAGKSNLTIQQLPPGIKDEPPRQKVTDLANAAVAAAEYCRNRRHCRIAHRALDLSLGVTTDPLPDLTRENIDGAMAGFAEVLNAISYHYSNSTTDFALISNLRGAVALIRVLDDGVPKTKERIAALERGELPPDISRRLEL